MRIAIIGANGRLGNMLLEEALDRGHNITVVVRSGSNLRGYRGVKVIEKDVLDLEYKDIQKNEVVINAIGVWEEEDMHIHKEATLHLLDILNGKNQRLLVVGGAGSLYTDESRTTRLMDTDDFPKEFKPMADAMAQGLFELEKSEGVTWTYLSPAADFQLEGKRTGFFKEREDILPLNMKGKSQISYADYAIAMISEAERGHHKNQRYSVVSR